MRTRKVLFVVPPYDCWGVQVIGTWPPLQLAYLAAVAEEAGCEARIFDAMNQDLDVRRGSSRDRDRIGPTSSSRIDYMPVTGAVSTATVPAALEALAVAKSVDRGYRHRPRRTAPHLPV